MALFSLVDEDLEHGLHLGQLLSCLRELGLQLLRSVVHDGRDGLRRGYAVSATRRRRGKDAAAVR